MKRIKAIISFVFLVMILTSCANTKNAITEKSVSVYKNIEDKSYSNDEYCSIDTYNPYVSIATTTKIFNENIGQYIGKTTFYNKYTTLDGIITFRGNNYRDTSAFGSIASNSRNLDKLWSFTTGTSSWGGGAGWTGQPLIVKWPKSTLKSMNVYDEFKNKENFVEVIQGSLDGNVYFLDLNTGKSSRPKIKVGNPLKGTPSLDSRGYPLLYVGEGIPESSSIGFNIFSLIDGTRLYHLDGIDKEALRFWGAFDSSALFNNDRLIVGGENGLVYIVDLNTKYSLESNSIDIKPNVVRYRYKTDEDNSRLGVENSLSAYKNLIYFADNAGVIQCVDLNTLTAKWTLKSGDDTDATITIEEENDTPYLYTGNEVDLQGERGVCTLRKLDGFTGKVMWEQKYNCYSIIGEHAVNGGLLATNILGKGDIKDYAIFSIARYKDFNGGAIVALDKKTGKEVWNRELKNYMWSSPVDIYDENNKGYIIQGDSVGQIYLIDGKTGNILSSISLGANIESTPAIFNDILVVASRNGIINAVKIK